MEATTMPRDLWFQVLSYLDDREVAMTQVSQRYRGWGSDEVVWLPRLRERFPFRQFSPAEEAAPYKTFIDLLNQQCCAWKAFMEKGLGSGKMIRDFPAPIVAVQSLGNGYVAWGEFGQNNISVIERDVVIASFEGSTVYPLKSRSTLAVANGQNIELFDPSLLQRKKIGQEGIVPDQQLTSIVNKDGIEWVAYLRKGQQTTIRLHPLAERKDRQISDASPTGIGSVRLFGHDYLWSSCDSQGPTQIVRFFDPDSEWGETLPILEWKEVIWWFNESERDICNERASERIHSIQRLGRSQIAVVRTYKGLTQVRAYSLKSNKWSYEGGFSLSHRAVEVARISGKQRILFVHMDDCCLKYWGIGDNDPTTLYKPQGENSILNLSLFSIGSRPYVAVGISATESSVQVFGLGDNVQTLQQLAVPNVPAYGLDSVTVIDNTEALRIVVVVGALCLPSRAISFGGETEPKPAPDPVPKPLSSHRTIKVFGGFALVVLASLVCRNVLDSP